jgi:hypothetical protein
MLGACCIRYAPARAAARLLDASAEFSYRVVAKRKGFERDRFDPAPWADRAAELTRRD